MPEEHVNPPTPEDEAQAWAEISDALLKFVIPLCTRPHGKRPMHVGTGVLVEVAGHHFVVSARHVLREAKSLFFYVKNKTVRKLSGTVVLGRVRQGNADRIDVAAMLLEGPGLPPYPEVDKFSLDGASVLAPAAIPRAGKHYLVTGFPASRSKANPHEMELKTEAWCLISSSMDLVAYNHLGLSQETHLVLPLERSATLRIDGSSQVFPDPHGMSGSPVWWLPDDSNGLELPKLVGIVIEYHKKYNALVATDVREAVHQISVALGWRGQRDPVKD